MLEADTFGASSNDVAQILDDWFVEHGFPSILYRLLTSASQAWAAIAASRQRAA